MSSRENRSQPRRWGLLVLGAAVLGALVTVQQYASRTSRAADGAKSDGIADRSAESRQRRQISSASAARSPTSSSIRGSVVAIGGRTAAGVTIRLGDGREVTSESDGKFEFSDVSVGMNLVSASGPEFTSTTVNTFVAENETVYVRLLLRAGVSLEVEVIDVETGEPITGATGVVALKPGGATVRVLSEEASSSDGILQFPAYPLGGVSLFVDAPGYVPSAGILSGGFQNGWKLHKTIALSRGAALRGVITDTGGSRIAAALVNWRLLVRGRSQSHQLPIRTDADGAFSVSVPANTRVELNVRHPDYEDVNHIHDGTEGAAAIHIELTSGRSVVGQVVDVDGQPVAGAVVSDAAEAVAGRRETVTSAAGEFTLRGLRMAGPAVYLFASTGEARSNLTLIPSDTSDAVVLRLVHNRVASGTVFLADGSPAAQAQVSCHQLRDSVVDDSDKATAPTPISASVLTDTQGRFSISGLAEGRYRATVSMASTTHQQPPQVAQTSGPLQVGSDNRFDLPSAAMLSGRVVDESGSPVSSFRIAVAGVLADINSEDGRFEFGPVFPLEGSLSLRVEAVGYMSAKQTIDPSKSASDLGEIELTRGHVIAGRVANRNGVGAAHAYVQVRGSGTEESARVGDDGEFQVTVGKLPVTVQAIAPGVGTSRALEMTSARSDVQMRVPETGRLEVRIDEGIASATPRLTLQALSAPRGGQLVLSLEKVPGDGSLYAGELPTGQYSIHVFASSALAGGQDSLGTVAVHFDETERFDLRRE